MGATNSGFNNGGTNNSGFGNTGNGVSGFFNSTNAGSISGIEYKAFGNAGLPSGAMSGYFNIAVDLLTL